MMVMPIIDILGVSNSIRAMIILIYFFNIICTSNSNEA